MKNIISPVTFIDPQESNNIPNTTRSMPQGYDQMNTVSYATPNMPQNYLTFNQQSNLYYQWLGNRLELEKNECKERIKLAALEESLRLRREDQIKRELTESSVVSNAKGEIFYNLTQNDYKSKKQLLDIYNLCSHIYFTENGSEVLAVSFIHYDKAETIIIELVEKNISADVIKKLGLKGIRFKVSRKGLKEAANAFVDYVINRSARIEIAHHRGWNLMSNGKWHFAREDEPTMQDFLIIANSKYGG